MRGQHGHRFAVLAKDLAKDAALLAERRVGLRAADEVGHQVVVGRARTASRFSQPRQGRADRLRVALAARPHEPGHVALLRPRRHLEDRDRRHLGLVDVGVDADDPPLAGVELALEAIRGVGDLGLGVALLDRFDHAAAPVDLVEVAPDLALGLVRERLDEPRSAERVDRVRDAGLLGDDLLLSEREESGLLGRDRERLVVGVGVERLRPTENCRERLERDPGQVVQRLLRRQ